MMAINVENFCVDIPDSKIQAIRNRVAEAKLPRQMPPSSDSSSMWETGMDVSWLDELRRYWVNEYDWKAAQAELNKFPQFIAEVDGLFIHFYHVRGEGESPPALLLIHGWPGSVIEFLDMIGPLTHPSSHGGNPADAFSVVIPSLPGFGFSSQPQKPINATTTAKIFNKLMTETLGHRQYFAQGGDFGGGVAVQLAYLYPEHVKGIHLNFVPWFEIPEADRTDEEKLWLENCALHGAREFDYMRLQANKTMMLAVALNDSPFGTAAWIAEKFWAWSDNGGDLEKIIPKRKLITNIMLYLVNSAGIDGSLWFYRGFRDEMKWSFFTGYVKTPTAITIFPGDYPISNPPLSAAKRGYNVVHYTAMPSGGHFAALERPKELVIEIRDGLRSLRN